MELLKKKQLLRLALQQKTVELKKTQRKAGAMTWLARKLGVSLRAVQSWARDDEGWTQTSEIEEKVWKLLDYPHPDEEEVDDPGFLSVISSDDNPIKVEVASPLTRISNRLMKCKALTAFMLAMQEEEEGLMTEMLQDLGLEPPSGSALKETLRKFQQQLTEFVNSADPIDVKLVFFRGKKPGDPEKK